jgi:hypothetical protein
MSIGYIRAKACRFVELGPMRYRSEDLYGQPDANLLESDLTLIERGMQQLADGKGFELDHPLTDIGAIGIRMLMPIVHFRLENVVSHYAESGVIDECVATHMLSDVTVTVFNFVLNS